MNVHVVFNLVNVQFHISGMAGVLYFKFGV